MRRVQMVVFDWAGTTVDYGCFAPVKALTESFAEFGTEVSVDEVRSFMGLKKRDHVQAMLGVPDVQRRWRKAKGEDPTDADVDAVYRLFEKKILASLEKYAEPIPGVPDIVRDLGNSQVKIGSTTGYTREMIDIVAAAAAGKGFAPDCIVASDDVPAGRPDPYMIWRNAVELAVPRLDAVVKVGDTVTDIKEGRNAGTWSVGVVEGGSAWGLSEDENAVLSDAERRVRSLAVRHDFLSAGAHHVIETMAELPSLLMIIEGLLGAGRSPG